MEYPSRPTWVDIDLSGLRHNLEQARDRCPPDQRILAVVKADAYGHGAVDISRALEAFGVGDFAVATLEEAMELRESGLRAPLLVLGGCFPGQEPAFIDAKLTPVVLDMDMAERLQQAAARRAERLPVHLKIDSGMGRVGLLPDQLREGLPRLGRMDNLEIIGCMSHLACADDFASAVTGQQLERFRAALRMLRESGIPPREVHLNNSAGLSRGQCPECTLSRPGIMLYGGLPGPQFSELLDLKPVMHLRSRIAQLRELPAGSGISYGHSYQTRDAARVAVMPIGYADGYNRLLSNRGTGVLHGRRVPVIGRVCMDWIMLDVSAVPQARVGDCVTLLGTADGQTISGDEWAALLETIPYEVYCRIGRRVPRYPGALPQP